MERFKIEEKATIITNTLNRLPKQGDKVEHVEAELSFVALNATIFPFQLAEVQELKEQDKRPREKKETTCAI